MVYIKAYVSYETKENEDGIEVDCVLITCSRCGHQVQIWGDNAKSIKRACATLNEQCPHQENNFYTTDEIE